MAAVLPVRCTAEVPARAGPSLFRRYTPTPMNLFPQQSKGGNNSADPDNPVNVGPPVFAKSCLRRVGCTDAGTHEEP